MSILVMKFGGTSVANLDRIQRAAKRVALEVARGHDVIVIVSAMAGETNKLVGWVQDTSPLYDGREYDAVTSSGENVTAGLMAPRLHEMDIPARSREGRPAPGEPLDAPPPPPPLARLAARRTAPRLPPLDTPARPGQGWQVPVNTPPAHGSARIES